MKTKEVTGVECEDCGSFAIVPQKDGTPRLETRYQCSECDSVYDNKEEADECCKEESSGGDD